MLASCERNWPKLCASATLSTNLRERDLDTVCAANELNEQFVGAERDLRSDLLSNYFFSGAAQCCTSSTGGGGPVGWWMRKRSPSGVTSKQVNSKLLQSIAVSKSTCGKSISSDPPAGRTDALNSFIRFAKNICLPVRLHRPVV